MRYAIPTYRLGYRTDPQGAADLTLSQGEQRSLMRELGQRSGQALEALGLLLDTPGAIARGVLAGDPMSGFSWDRDTRVTGEELLDQYGLKPKNEWVSPFMGFAAEVATDPLAAVSFPLNAMNKAGRAARAANLLQDAPRIAQTRMGTNAAAQTMTGAYTLADMQRAGVPITDAMLKTRPLIGPRLAQATLTLDDVVQGSANPQQALTQVQRYLSRSGTNYADVAGQKLGGTLGVDIPFTGMGGAFNPFGQRGAEAIADTLDRVGQGIAWSYPSRLASAFVNQSVGGMTDTLGQTLAMRQSDLLKSAETTGRRLAATHAMGLRKLAIPDQVAQRTGISTLFSGDGNSALTRILEGVPNAQDTDLLTNTPGLRQWVDEWRAYAQQANLDAQRMGLPSPDLNDPFGIQYTPRAANELSQGAKQQMFGGGPSYLAKTSDMTGRADALKVPGGTDTLRKISLDPRVREYSKLKTSSAQTDQDIARHIQTLTPVPLEQAERIARIMRGMADDLPDDIPLFSAHPILSQTNYMVGRQMAQGNAEAVYESLADAALNQQYTLVPGGGHYTLKEAMEQIGKKVGFATNPRGGLVSEVEDQLRQRIAARTGAQASSINLALYSVPESIISRLTRVNEFYSTPEAQSQVMKLWDGFTSMFKGYVLAWPSRYVRDLYSGAFSNWLENGSWQDTLTGMHAASNIVAGKPDVAFKVLSSIPQYANLGSQQDVIDNFLIDAGTHGVLQGLSSADLMFSNQTGEALNSLLPGSTPMKISSGLRELGSQQGRTWTQFGKDLLPTSMKGIGNEFQTRNPVLRAGEKIGDVTDAINRLGGYISLLKQGASPEFAARRVRASQVDYSSLTPYERKLRQSLFPWWAYQSRAGKYVVENILNAPGGRYAQTVRFLNDMQATNDESYVPTALRQRVAFLSPFHEQGDIRTYITGVGLPGLDEINTLRLSYQPDTSKAVLQSARDTLGEVMQEAHPLIRTVGEIATGQDFFSKRPLDEAYTPVDRIYQALSGDQQKLDPLIRGVVANIPGLQRPIQLFGALADQRIPMDQRLIKAGINTTGGFKLQNVDAEAELLDLRAKIGHQNAPYNRSFVQQYIPDESLPFVPMENQKLEALDRLIQKDLRARWQAEKNGVPKQFTGTAVNPLYSL